LRIADREEARTEAAAVERAAATFPTELAEASAAAGAEAIAVDALSWAVLNAQARRARPVPASALGRVSVDAGQIRRCIEGRRRGDDRDGRYLASARTTAPPMTFTLNVTPPNPAYAPAPR
jgi:hypothetical protein